MTGPDVARRHQLESALVAEVRKPPTALATLLRMGTILAFDATTYTATVALGGDTVTPVTGVAVLRDGYLPLVNDTAWIAQTGTDLLIVGGHQTNTTVERRLAFDTSTAVTTTTAGAEIFDSNLYTQLPVVAGLKYRITVDGRVDSSAANTAWALRIRISAISASPSNPTTASTQVGGDVGTNAVAGGGGEVGCHGVGYFTPASTGNLIFGVSIARLAGTGELSLRNPETNTPITVVASVMGEP